MIAQESSPEFPCLPGRRQAPDVARNCAFRDVEAEFEKFTIPIEAPSVNATIKDGITVRGFFRTDYDLVDPMSIVASQSQADWRYCNKCQGLFFGGGLANSRCPAGGTHAAPQQSGSGNYSLWHNVVAAPHVQSDWRWCNKCQGLFYGLSVAASRCPAGSTHATPQPRL